MIELERKFEITAEEFYRISECGKPTIEIDIFPLPLPCGIMLRLREKWFGEVSAITAVEPHQTFVTFKYWKAFSLGKERIEHETMSKFVFELLMFLTLAPFFGRRLLKKRVVIRPGVFADQVLLREEYALRHFVEIEKIMVDYSEMEVTGALWSMKRDFRELVGRDGEFVDLSYMTLAVRR